MDAPSDLIVDVARAADPTRASTVTRRLEALAADGGTGAADFASALGEVGEAGGLAPAPVRPAAPAQPTVASREDKARVQFEATILNSFISEMMPKDASAVYGEGYAGDMWRSLLAEKMSNEIAKSGSLGLARGLFGGGRAATIDKLEGASRAKGLQADVTLASANPLSLPTGATSADGAYLFARGKPL
jgi:hypothetical protein